MKSNDYSDTDNLNILGYERDSSVCGYVCDLIQKSVRMFPSVYPLRPKTPEYTNTVFDWRDNNRKIIQVMEIVPVFLIVRKNADGKLCLEAFRHQKYGDNNSESILVFFSEEQAEKELSKISSGKNDLEIIQSCFSSLFDSHNIDNQLQFPQDCVNIVFCDCRPGKQWLCVQKQIMSLIYEARNAFRSPFPPQYTVITQSFKCHK